MKPVVVLKWGGGGGGTGRATGRKGKRAKKGQGRGHDNCLSRHSSVLLYLHGLIPWEMSG